jgi:hypothetical protein
MRKSLLVGGACLALTLSAVSGLRLAHAEDCQDVLDNNVYLCHVKSDFGSEFTDCYRFTSPGTQSYKFDLYADVLGQVQGCSCKAAGSFGTPDFNGSKEFECVTTGEEDFQISFSGKADGTQLKKGQIVSEFGDSFIFECSLKPNCSVGLESATRTENPYKQH